MKDKKVPIPLNEKATLNLGQLLKVEEEILKERRNIRNENKNLREDSLGIALSGGGIRSATICLGIMEKLNSIGLLKKSDYLSSVSGGGYLASYIHMARNKSNPTTYEKLFDKEVISHFRNYRTHFFIAPRFKLFSNAFLGLILLSSFLMSWMWIILPTYFFIFSGMGTFLHYVILLFLFILPGIFLSPNFTSLHRFYKNRLSKAYLWLNQNIKLIQLTDINSPYPLINATVHVNKDDYHNADSVSYRGNINSNYFLFSPFYCGSQVTRYAKNSASSYSNFTLGSAMATSGAAINTFMGNMNIFVPIRWLMILLNVRIGLLAPSPFLKRKIPVFGHTTLY